MSEIKFKHWVYFFTAFSVPIVALSTGVSILYLFSGSIALFLGLAIAFGLGWHAHQLYPPPTAEVQLQILEILQELQTGGGSEVDESFFVGEVEICPVVRYLPAGLSNLYLIMSWVEGEPIYLATMTNTEKTFTARQEEALRFQDLYKAWVHCWVLYLQMDRSPFEVVAINPVKQVELYEQTI